MANIQLFEMRSRSRMRNLKQTDTICDESGLTHYFRNFNSGKGEGVCIYLRNQRFYCIEWLAVKVSVETRDFLEICKRVRKQRGYSDNGILVQENTAYCVGLCTEGRFQHRLCCKNSGENIIFDLTTSNIVLRL